MIFVILELKFSRKFPENLLQRIFKIIEIKCKYCFKFNVNENSFFAYPKKRSQYIFFILKENEVSCFIECLKGLNENSEFKDFEFKIYVCNSDNIEKIPNRNTNLDKYEVIIKPSRNHESVISAIISAFENKIKENPLCNYLKKYLVITDPYFLNFDENDKILITKLFKNLKNILINLKKVILIIPSRNYDRNKFNELKNTFTNLGLELDLKIDNNKRGKGLFHDRFWIFFGGDTTNCCGLIVGTSLNGLGKKYALIENLSYEDALTIMEDIERLFGVS